MQAFKCLYGAHTKKYVYLLYDSEVLETCRKHVRLQKFTKIENSPYLESFHVSIQVPSLNGDRTMLLNLIYYSIIIISLLHHLFSITYFNLHIAK